ncbi:MAG TPA: peptidylprolyl isomerase [Blastocatellia bacterium]|nr:peptidylprolyl isomerase [Blastocatellia bacterium]
MIRIGGILTTVLLSLALGGIEPRIASADSPHDLEQATGASEYDNLEAVLDTSLGQIVIEFFPKEAPRHVEYFVKHARSGAYEGTTFHRFVKYALIQGGDPLSRNPRDRARYGTGGLNVGLPDEVNKNKHVAGAVASVLQAVSAGSTDVKPGTSGAQFFIVLNAGSAQANLDRAFTVFGKVVEGMDVVTRISTSAASTAGVAAERIEITKVTIREKSPNADQMKTMRAAIETSLGNLKLQLLPESAPNTARSFVRCARAGLYDGTTFFRVSQNYFMELGYLGDWPQDSPNRKRIFSTWPIAAEKSDVKQERGTVSMRQNPDGTTSWYFFIISKENPALDGKHVPFAKVVEGLDVLDKIAEAEVEGDKPKQRIEIKKITVQ